MNTASPTTYDHRLRNIVHATQDMSIALELGVAEQYISDAKTMGALFGPGAYAFFAREPENHKLVGMVRVLSNDKFCTWVAELCVDPKYQRFGIGRKLMGLMIERIGHTSIYGEALSEQAEFFSKLEHRTV